jgi:carbonic anhydrase
MKMLQVATLVLLVQLFPSCKSNSNKISNENNKSFTGSYRHQHVLTKAEQDQLTPDQVLFEFKKGNARFKNGNVTQREHSEDIRKIATGGQYPKAIGIKLFRQ